jgi:uncharacterized protein YkwD
MKKQTQNLIIFPIALVATTFSFTVAFASPINEANLTNLINGERESRDLPLLNINNDLDNSATLKSKDMINRDYFDHYAFGLSPWDFIANGGYDYLYAGENLAMDFQTSEGMVKAWMNSPTHRDNILNPEYRDLGIGVVKGTYTENGTEKTTTIVTTMFGREKPPIVKWIDSFKRLFSQGLF